LHAALVTACATEPSETPATPATLVTPVTPVPPAARAVLAAKRAAAGRELADLSASLDAWTARADWPTLAGDPCPELSSRLAAFTSRFDVAPDVCVGWDDLSARAAGAYARLVAQIERPVAGWQYADAWLAPRWTGVRAVLLDVSGRRGEAHELLFGDEPREHRGCCWMDHYEDMFAMSRFRAEQLDREGDGTGALRWLNAALFFRDAEGVDAGFRAESPALDLVLARHAELLRDPGACPAASACSADPTLSIVQVSFCGDPDRATRWDSTCIATLVGVDDESASWRLLDVSFPGSVHGDANWPEPTERVVCAATDERVLAYLERIAADEEIHEPGALLALHAVTGSVRDRLRGRFERLDPGLGLDRDRLQGLDWAARRICGGGPASTPVVYPDQAGVLRDAWLRWLADEARSTDVSGDGL
jgi:hypothetical protein